MTPKQKLQQHRSWFKFRIIGAYTPISSEFLTSDELANMNLILEARNRILACFDENSRSLGLNVPEHKCWCGKPAKVEIDYYGNGNVMWVCNKHNENFK